MSTYKKSLPILGGGTKCLLPPIAVAGAAGALGAASNLTTGAWIDPGLAAGRRVRITGMVGADGGNFAEVDFWLCQAADVNGGTPAVLDTAAHLIITAANSVANAEVDLAATGTALDMTKFLGVQAKVKNSSGTASTIVGAFVEILDPMFQSPNWP
jgi:hypothetical protein